MNKPSFYIFVGVDGAGKTTTAKKLQEELIGNYLFTYEPFYDQYKELLATINNPMERGYIFTCDRIRHFHKVVLPALNQGKTVIMDRGHYCNIAYQTVEASLCSDTYAYTLSQILGKIQPAMPPHKVIWFYCDPKIAYERKGEFDPEHLAEIQRIYKAILPQNTVIIDTTYDSATETLKKVKDIIL